MFGPHPLRMRYRTGLIIDVTANSQADNAGVRVGWRIQKVNGDVQTMNDINITNAIEQSKENGENTIILFQLPLTKKVKFGSGDLGIRLKGNQIVHVIAGSQAENAGVRCKW